MSNDLPDRSCWRILIVGTGGQGVLTVARLLCDCFVACGYDVISGQLHGMAQRGGSVQSSIIIGGAFSPVIATGGADIVIGLEPVETVRAMPFMSSRTLVYMNTCPVIPFTLAIESVLKTGTGEYPDIGQLQKNLSAITTGVIAFDATALAAQIGSEKAMNMVMLGCLFSSDVLPCSAETFLETMTNNTPKNRQKLSTAAFCAGQKIGEVCTIGNHRP